MWDGAFIQRALDSFFGFLAHPVVALVAAGLILLWALISWFWFVRQLGSPMQSLANALRTIRGAPDADAFVGRYESTSAALRADAVMGHAWAEFSETIITPEEPGERI